MDGSGAACILPKLPLVRRNVTAIIGLTTRMTYNSTTCIHPVSGSSVPCWSLYPIPCWTLGAMPLVYVYFGIGIILTMVLILYGQVEFLRNLMAGKQFKTRCSCRNQPTDLEDTGVKAEVAEILGVEKPAVDRLQALSEAKANRSKLSIFLAEAATPQTTLGQILMLIGVICSAISLAIYLNAVSRKRDSLEMCGTMPNGPQIVDFFVNVYLLLYFIVRVAGSERRQKTLTTMYSIVDYFTIPCVIISALLDRYFTGFSFFRAYNLLWLVEILAYRRILKSINATRLVKLVVLVFAITLIAAGFLHVVENMGDPWLAEPDGTPLYNGQSIAFWRCFLYVYGRITLLDLSMLRMHTMMGRVIIYGFQILALGIIGQAIPQIMMRLKIKPDYDKSYAESKMFIHVIVCGHVTARTMEAFLEEFYHPDRDSSEFYKIVILSEQPPDEDMGLLQERYFSKLDYYRGTVMDMKDLNRVRLSDAKATLILADRTAPDVDADDAANIMRVVSIKNYRLDAQIIVQLSQYHNKAFLQNIPNWNPEKGDIVICLAELRLGLLAQSCIAPGFSTLMANFFTTRSFDPKKANVDKTWMQDYRRGTALELYCRPFSIAFDGMTYTQACEFCYSKLKIVLLAIQIDPMNAALVPQINPPPNVTIDCSKKTVGYFIADNTTQVDRAQFYCTKCHLGVEELERIGKCDCPDVQAGFAESSTSGIAGHTTILARTMSSMFHDEDAVESKIWSYINASDRSPKSQSLENIPQTVEGEAPAKPKPPGFLYDSTGMFYWVKSRPIESVTINRKKAANRDFRNHIVVCVMSQEKSQISGLSSFVLPLRSSVIKPEDLQDILLLGDPKYLEKEWKYLYNLPNLYVVKGTALNRSDLRSVNLNTCRMCVVLGAPTAGGDKNNDPTMADKSVILATLNVRAMKFSAEEYGSCKYTPGEKKHRNPSLSTGYDVPLITDLMRDSNVQFLDDRDQDLPGKEFYLTEPYTGGRAFTASVLDLLMVTCFFNPTIMKSVHTIVFGGASLELERIMAEGAGLIGGDNISKPAENKNQVSVQQISVNSGPLSVHIGYPYGGLFIDALQTMGLVVLGLYRPVEAGSTKRFVICNPPETFLVQEDDEVYALNRANSVIQPPLRPSSMSSSNRRLVDIDVQTLERDLKSMDQDVAKMEQRYLTIRQNNNTNKNNNNRTAQDDRSASSAHEQSPLLQVNNDSSTADGDGYGESSPLPSDSSPTYRPPAPSFAVLERKEIDEQLRIMEEKLAKMKADVVLLQEKYIKFAFGDYV